jgi:hypothetical protein
MIIREWICKAPEQIDRCTDADQHHVPFNRKRAVDLYMCGYMNAHIRCDHRGCKEQVDLKKWSMVRASSYYGWFIKKDETEAYCFDHLPTGIIEWRDSKKPNWRKNLSKKLRMQMESKESIRANRLLTADERIQARHRLQALGELAFSARNAMEPITGVQRITVESWTRQWNQMTKDLDAFLGQIIDGAPTHPYNTGDRSA